MTQTLTERHQLKQVGIPVFQWKVTQLVTSKNTIYYIPKDHNDTVNRVIMNYIVKEAKNTKYEK